MTDVLIIGGGIAGLSAAAALAPHMGVTLLEAEDAFGYHTSGRSAALFLDAYGNETVRALNLASRPVLESRSALTPTGCLIVGGSHESRAFEETCGAFAASTLPVEQAIARVPILDPHYLAHAAWIDEIWDIDTDLLMQSYAREARAAGAVMRTGVRVTAIARSHGRWHLTANGETLTASHLVNAAGAWARQIGELAGARPIALQPLRRSVARMPAPGGHDVAGWPVILGAGETFFAKPDAGRWLVSPLEEDPAEPHDAWADDMFIAEGIARYQPFVTEEVTRIDMTWAGLRTFAPDRALVVGEDPRRAGFWWLAGQGGYGFQTAPAAADLLAALLTGRAPALSAGVMTALSPDRAGIVS